MADGPHFATLRSNRPLLPFERHITAKDYAAIRNNDAKTIASLTSTLSIIGDWVCGTDKVKAVRLAVMIANEENDPLVRLESAAALERLATPAYKQNFAFERRPDGQVAVRITGPDKKVWAFEAPVPSRLDTLTTTIFGTEPTQPVRPDAWRARAKDDPALTEALAHEGLPEALKLRSQPFLPPTIEFELLGGQPPHMKTCYAEMLHTLGRYETFCALREPLDEQRRQQVEDGVQHLSETGLLPFEGGTGSPPPTIDDRIFAPYLSVREMGPNAWLVDLKFEATNHNSPYSRYEATVLLSGDKMAFLFTG
ncbi:hypothetical protein [Pandoraea oxalativorans]|uniref:Uncharacterized protein n=1 Tax=Pandoraea oxalativorans TaxID=573737 RepID=A0A0G3IFF2_9BURK|nr:hypothetical protein [Pandoraea oxalativorans]AKK24641.1 hypothetical protein MB84_27775 [Pandoraea oxalativorans]